MKNYWEKLALVLQEEPLFFAIVGENTAHSPGTAGARMFATKTQSWGTIGGGIMEFELLNRGRALLEKDEEVFFLERRIHREGAGDFASGLFCAGEQWLIFGIIKNINIIGRFTNSSGDGLLKIEPSGLTTHSPSSIGVRYKGLVKTDIDAWCYEELFFNPKRIAIVGGGHCGLALSRVMHQLGFYVSVFDIRETTTFLRIDCADERKIVNSYKDIGKHIAQPETTHVVIMSADVGSDVEALSSLDAPYPYIGLMGSPAKIAKIKKNISPELFSRLSAPIGMPIGSHTPEEIAISIAAEIISLASASKVP